MHYLYKVKLISCQYSRAILMAVKRPCVNGIQCMHYAHQIAEGTIFQDKGHDVGGFVVWCVCSLGKAGGAHHLTSYNIFIY